MTILQVAIGGALGAMLRFLCGLVVAFPYATVLVNVLGSFLMGLAFVWLSAKGLERWSPFLMVGVLGGFTTFSAFSLDTLRLVEAGQIGSAGLYVLGSVLMCLCAVWLGVFAARGLLA